MNPAEKLLAAALRSGDYKQGTGVLCQLKNKEECHCCLGVGEELFKIICGDQITYREYVAADGCFRYVDTDGNLSQTALLPGTAQWLNWSHFGKLDPKYYSNITAYLQDGGYSCSFDEEEQELRFEDDREVKFDLSELNDIGVKFEHIAHIIEQGWVKKELVETNFNSLDPDKRLVFQLIDTNPLNGNHEYVKLTKQAIYNTGYNAVNLTTMMPTYLTDDQLVKVKGPLTIKKD